MLRQCVRVARMMLAKDDAEKSGMHRAKNARRFIPPPRSPFAFDQFVSRTSDFISRSQLGA
jgi:hypothetical protein